MEIKCSACFMHVHMHDPLINWCENSENCLPSTIFGAAQRHIIFQFCHCYCYWTINMTEYTVHNSSISCMEHWKGTRSRIIYFRLIRLHTDNKFKKKHTLNDLTRLPQAATTNRGWCGEWQKLLWNITWAGKLNFRQLLSWNFGMCRVLYCTLNYIQYTPIFVFEFNGTTWVNCG